MASSDSLPSSSSLLECNICKKEFNEDNLPRVLPCTHVFCSRCLAELATNHRGVIPCPECRQKHNVAVKELRICRTTMKLQEIERTQRTMRAAEAQKQMSNRSDPASAASGQPQSASKTFGTDIQGLVTSLEMFIFEASQSGEILEEAINESHRRREALLQTMETATQTITDRMDRVIKAATERKQQLLQSLGDAFQESLSLLTDMENKINFRKRAHKRFCSTMAEEAALQEHAQADPEEIRKLVKELLDGNHDFHDNISIPLKELSLDTEDESYQSFLTGVSSWGDIKIEQITYEVPSVPLQPMTRHYLAKTKAMHTISWQQPLCVDQLQNGDIAIASFDKQYTVHQSQNFFPSSGLIGPQVQNGSGNRIAMFDSDLKFRRDFSLPQPIYRGGIGEITGMCVTPSGNLCISSYNAKIVNVCTPEGRLEKMLQVAFHPRGLAGNKEGEVFVCDEANHLVRVFDQSGQECRRFGGQGKEPGKLCGPRDVSVTPEGKVAVADTGNHRIQVFDGATGRYLASFGSHGSGPNQLNMPQGIAIDSMGFVAVAETGNQRIQLFNPSWESFHIIKNQEDPFQYPWGIKITKDNAIVVCDYHGHRVQIF